MQGGRCFSTPFFDVFIKILLHCFCVTGVPTSVSPQVILEQEATLSQ